MSPLALGLMSGTSADGCSAVLASFSNRSFRIIDSLTNPYPIRIKKQVHQGARLNAAQVSKLNMELGNFFAETACRLLKKSRLSSHRISCIGSHGQTIYHGPHDRPSNTLQVGDPRVIAERTRITVVSDFRPRDIAAGGQGAPLIPYFDYYFFGQGPVRAFQNIGGISNVTIVGKRISHPVAFDNGPGNCLMDLAVRLHSQGRHMFDRSGNRARKGVVLIKILEDMLRHPYLKKPPPKSTGPELFDERFLRIFFGPKFSGDFNDVCATLNQFTATSIHQSYRRFLFPKYNVQEIFLSGGGVLNRTLVQKLNDLFDPIPVKSTEDLGVPPLIKEPLAFAFYGLRCLQKKINHWGVGTGAARNLILGSITPA